MYKCDLNCKTGVNLIRFLRECGHPANLIKAK